MLADLRVGFLGDFSAGGALFFHLPYIYGGFFAAWSEWAAGEGGKLWLGDGMEGKSLLLNAVQ
jgi:hypothetical protein